MITDNNKLNEIGDEIVFQTTPLFGLSNVTNFNDTLNGLTSDRTISKSFCYSFDGVVFTDWIDLTSLNLQNEINSKLTPTTEPVFRFRYQRTGIDDTGIIELVELNLIGTYSEPKPSYSTSWKSIFKKYVYDQIDVYNLRVNLAQKMYDFGTIPAYFIRKELDFNIYEDKDYIDFWSTVSKFFSLFLIFGFKLETIYWRREYISEFLRQRGLYYADADDIIDMQLLVQNYYDEIRQRGTPDIFRTKGYEYIFGERYAYPIPDDFVISMSYPVYIDGIAYNNINELPFGWVVREDLLISPDKNNHEVIFGNIDPGTIVIDGDYDNDYNDDFLIDLTQADNRVIVPSGGASGIYKKNNGEYLRLICYDAKFDEFIYNQLNLKDFGWNLNNSSPLFRGLRIQRNKTIIKGYETTRDFVDLDNYPIL